MPAPLRRDSLGPAQLGLAHHGVQRPLRPEHDDISLIRSTDCPIAGKLAASTAERMPPPLRSSFTRPIVMCGENGRCSRGNPSWLTSSSTTSAQRCNVPVGSSSPAHTIPHRAPRAKAARASELHLEGRHLRGGQLDRLAHRRQVRVAHLAQELERYVQLLRRRPAHVRPAGPFSARCNSNRPCRAASSNAMATNSRNRYLPCAVRGAYSMRSMSRYCATRASSSALVTCSTRRSEKSSMANEAATVPRTIACFSVARSCRPAALRYPSVPPAKLSPAPVGSFTFLLGNAGIASTPSPVTSSAPCSPFLMMMNWGP